MNVKIWTRLFQQTLEREHAEVINIALAML